MSSVHKQKPTLWQMIKSVLAAMLGVQSAKAQQRDFTHGKPWMYVVLGLIAVTLFVLILYGVVHLVVSSTKVK